MYVELNNIRKEYVTRKKFLALRGIDLRINKGEFVGIMGPSGAGKTTLLNILATIDDPTEGKLIIDQKEVTKLSRNKKADYRSDYLGFIFQDYNLVNNMTVEENILLPGMIKGKVDINGMELITKKLGISSLLDKYPYELSGGEKQRTGAARAILKEPKLLLADEPTGNLDSKSATDFLNVIQSLNQERNLTTIMVTHDPYVASFTDRVLILKDGKIFSEINKMNNRKTFHNALIQSLSFLGGE